MAQVLVTESYLDDIADAIRGKNGSEDTYTPAQMAGAIEDIQTADEVVLVSKSVTANGTYNPASDSADGYSGVTVNVPNTYTAADEGKVVSSGALVAQESQNVSQNGTYDTTLKNQVVVAVPNSYSESDEGKVVNNGTLVAQTTTNIGENGTYDTTLNNSIIVNVSGGGDEGIIYGTSDPISDIGENGDYYYVRKITNIFGYERTPNQSSQTSQCGYEFTANKNIDVIGLRCYLRSAKQGVSLLFADSNGTIIGRIDDLNCVTGWNEAYFDNPISMASGNNYIVMVNVGSGSYLSYQPIYSAEVNDEITVVRGRYGGMPGNQDSTYMYSADVIMSDHKMHILKQFYKDSGAWVQL